MDFLEGRNRDGDAVARLLAHAMGYRSPASGGGVKWEGAGSGPVTVASLVAGFRSFFDEFEDIVIDNPKAGGSVGG